MSLTPVPEDWQRALAAVAHPDDLEYGAASAIAKWTAADKSVVELMATKGEAGINAIDPERCAEIRTAEQTLAGKIVGAETVEFLDHPDGVLEYGLPLRRDLAMAIRKHRPEILVSGGFRDTGRRGRLQMADHRVFGLALLDAARDAANPWVFPELLDEGYEPWDGVRFGIFLNSPRMHHYVDVTGHHDAGVAALLAHKVYFEHVSPGYDMAAFLTGITEQDGAAAGVPMATAFELIEL